MISSVDEASAVNMTSIAGLCADWAMIMWNAMSKRALLSTSGATSN